jgi:hypothetical protein
MRKSTYRWSYKQHCDDIGTSLIIEHRTCIVEVNVRETTFGIRPERESDNDERHSRSRFLHHNNTSYTLSFT